MSQQVWLEQGGGEGSGAPWGMEHVREEGAGSLAGWVTQCQGNL